MTQSKAPLIDIAVNLTDKVFADDLESVLARAQQAGVNQLIIPGSTLEESRQAIQLCDQYPGLLFSTVGVHPHYSRDFPANGTDQLKQLYRHPGVRAIGETGLDFNRDFSPRADQIRAFEQQLELACELNAPVLMHERDAHQRFVEIIAHYRDHLPRALLHCFTGDVEQLHRLLDLDLHIGITGWLCDERRGQHLQEVIKQVPLDRLMLETDAPYLLPRTLRPKPKSRRNEPANLRHICDFSATLLGLTGDQLAELTSSTARTFFALPEPGDKG